MQYRKLPHGGEQISILGLGTSSIQFSSEKEIEETICLAVENEINYFDMASAEAKPFPAYGRALAGSRDKVYFQIHFGADYASGTYGWTTDLDTIKRSVDWQLSALKTDYIDFGFIHCIDEAADPWILRCRAGRKGLFHHCRVCPAGRRRRLCILQSLRAVSGRAEHRADQ